MLSTFDQYVERANQSGFVRSTIVTAPGLEIYVRTSIRYPGVITLAHIRAKKERRGNFTRFLEQWSPLVPLEVEYPHNPHLHSFLKRLGWHEVTIDEGVHMFNDLAFAIVEQKNQSRR